MSLKDTVHSKPHMAVAAWNKRRSQLPDPATWSCKLRAKVLLMSAKRMEILAANYHEGPLKKGLLRMAWETRSVARSVFRLATRKPSP